MCCYGSGVWFVDLGLSRKCLGHEGSSVLVLTGALFQRACKVAARAVLNVGGNPRGWGPGLNKNIKRRKPSECPRPLSLPPVPRGCEESQHLHTPQMLMPPHYDWLCLHTKGHHTFPPTLSCFLSEIWPQWNKITYKWENTPCPYSISVTEL